jgi:hypothetical protein
VFCGMVQILRRIYLRLVVLNFPGTISNFLKLRLFKLLLFFMDYHQCTKSCIPVGPHLVTLLGLRK